MENNLCPGCGKMSEENVLYKCVRCFIVYCKECPDTNSGSRCPKCGMSQRMILSTEKCCDDSR